MADSILAFRVFALLGVPVEVACERGDFFKITALHGNSYIKNVRHQGQMALFCISSANGTSNWPTRQLGFVHKKL